MGVIRKFYLYKYGTQTIIMKMINPEKTCPMFVSPIDKAIGTKIKKPLSYTGGVTWGGSKRAENKENNKSNIFPQWGLTNS